MRNLLVIIAILLTAFVLYRLSTFTPQQSSFLDRYPAVQQCKTIDEAAAVLGCPPGRYAKTNVAYVSPPDLSANVMVSGEIADWTGDDCWILVRKRTDGTIVHTWLVYPAQSPSWFSRFSALLGW